MLISFATLPLAISFATLPLAISFATLPLAISFATLPLAIPFATLPLAIPFHFISFHFISFHSISFHFIPFHSISFSLHRLPVMKIILNLFFKRQGKQTHRTWPFLPCLHRHRFRPSVGRGASPYPNPYPDRR